MTSIMEISTNPSMFQTFRRSLRMIEQQAKRSNRTPEEIQATLKSFKHLHTRELVTIYDSIRDEFDKLESLVKSSAVISEETKTRYLMHLSSLRTVCHNYHLDAHDMVDAIGESMIGSEIPCVTYMINLHQRFHNFVASVKCDTPTFHFIKQLYEPFCEKLVKEIKMHSA